MFIGLAFWAFIACDSEHYQIKPLRAHEHLLDKFLMTWHINDATHSSRGKVELCKTKLDCHLSGFFFREPVGISTGQSCDKG
ncbi:MAG: hypothetical protein BWX90_00738 [bacterium ADurb.Bin132]|nr:MAG: hypothetical protein BWX90_00738 [bacterium ADurb.Bin132]